MGPAASRRERRCTHRAVARAGPADEVICIPAGNAVVTGIGVAPPPALRRRLHGSHGTTIVVRVRREEPLGLRVADPYLPRGRYGFATSAHAELAEDGGDVVLGGFLGDEELAGDVGVGAADAEQG